MLHVSKTAIQFAPPMECLPVAKIPTGDLWVYELLCDAQHKSSSVAFGIMWRRDSGTADTAIFLVRGAT
jgi:hypothetical protein